MGAEVALAARGSATPARKSWRQTVEVIVMRNCTKYIGLVSLAAALSGIGCGSGNEAPGDGTDPGNPDPAPAGSEREDAVPNGSINGTLLYSKKMSKNDERCKILAIRIAEAPPPPQPRRWRYLSTYTTKGHRCWRSKNVVA